MLSLFDEIHILLSWIIVYCDYWIELVTMTTGNSLGVLEWVNWLWVGLVQIDLVVG